MTGVLRDHKIILTMVGGALAVVAGAFVLTQGTMLAYQGVMLGVDLAVPASTCLPGPKSPRLERTTSRKDT